MNLAELAKKFSKEQQTVDSDLPLKDALKEMWEASRSDDFTSFVEAFKNAMIISTSRGQENDDT